MPELIPVIDKETIANNIASVAKQISIDYEHTELVLVGVLKGAFVFLADLARELTLSSISIEFVRLSSYGNDTTASGKMRLIMDIESDIKGKDILIVEDIFDTGKTVDYLSKHLLAKGAQTIKTCVLIDKHERRQVSLQPDYVCHTIEKGYLVGYGLDCAEAYRNLPEVYKLTQDCEPLKVR